jgi:tetratricopeptide (TPR) repeat protein
VFFVVPLGFLNLAVLIFLPYLYSKAIELDKDYIAAVYNRGNAFLKLGKEDLAYKDLSTAIELDANFYQAYYNRGV